MNLIPAIPNQPRIAQVLTDTERFEIFDAKLTYLPGEGLSTYRFGNP